MLEVCKDIWSNVFQPVSHEYTEIPVTIQGDIPDNLYGDILRIGPNPYHSIEMYRHWFDGDGMIHKISITHEKTVTYSNRWVQTQALVHEARIGRKMRRGLWTPAKKPLIDNTANTSLIYYAGKLLAAWEQGVPYEIDPKTLKTIGSADFLQHTVNTVSAHSKICPWTKNLVVHSHDLRFPMQHEFVEWDSSLQLKRKHSVPANRPSVIHDFALTKNFYILFDLPLLFQAVALKEEKFPYKYFEGHDAYVYIISRSDNRVLRVFNINPCFVFHFIRAFEYRNLIIVEGIRIAPFDYEKPLVKTSYPNRGQIYRWAFDLNNGNVKENLLGRRYLEFPCLKRKMLIEPSQSDEIYAAIFANESRPLFSGVGRFSLQGDFEDIFWMPDGIYCGEPLLIHQAEADLEDPEFIFVLASSDTKERSYGFFLNARSLQQGPIAVLDIPCHIPPGFHSIWLPQFTNKKFSSIGD